jgi:hypothetical protein
MRISRSYAVAGAAWLVLVVVGALLVWTVISRAGQGVVSQPAAPIDNAAPITAPAPTKRAHRPKSAKPRPHRPSGSASASPGGKATSGPPGPGSPSSTPNSGPTTPPSTGAGPGPAPAPGPGPGPSSPPNNPPSSSPPQPSPSHPQNDGVTRSWQGSAGVVTVECNGSTISLKGAQPNSGWSIDVDERGPEEVRVDFDNGERRTRVHSECVGGSPRFDVDQGDD